MQYVAIKNGQNLLYRELNSKSFIDTLKELSLKKWRVEIYLAELDQNKVQHRIELAGNYDKYKQFYLEFFEVETSLPQNIFNLLTFDQKMIMFDELFGICH